MHKALLPVLAAALLLPGVALAQTYTDTFGGGGGSRRGGCDVAGAGAVTPWWLALGALGLVELRRRRG